MKARLFTFLSAVSLLLLVAVCIIWVRSFYVADRLNWKKRELTGTQIHQWYLTVASGRGGISFCRDAEIYEAGNTTPRSVETGKWSGLDWQTARPSHYPTQAFFSRTITTGGFAFVWHTDGATMLRDVIVPYWFLALMLSVLPSAWLSGGKRRRRMKRLKAGMCPECGYDLRATPDRCPECGAAPVPHVISSESADL